MRVLREELDALASERDELNAKLKELLVPDSRMLDQEIDWDALTTRIRTVLWQLKREDGGRLKTYRDLAFYSVRALRSMKGIGDGSVELIEAHLQSLGLKLQA